MKSKLFYILFLMISIIFTGCGSGNTGYLQEEKTIYRDIVVERKDFPDFKEDFFKRNGKNHVLKYLGIQFLGEEPIQLWAERYAKKDNTGKIYQWGLDGKEKLLAEDIPDDFTIGTYNWYLDQEGYFYLIEKIPVTNLMIKIDAQGRELFRIKADTSVAWKVKKMCQAPDKKIYLTISETGREDRLAELDAEEGKITILEQVQTGSENVDRRSFYLGAGVNGPAICGWADIREVDTEQGKMTDVLLFNGTSYTIAGGGIDRWYEDIVDFRVAEECVEILRSDLDGDSVYVERLTQKEFQKIPVVLCASAVNVWTKHQISRFNRENETYYIVTEEFGASDGSREAEYEEGLKDYARRISIEVAAGKGPDILIGEDILGGNATDMIEKGVLEDLRPYMERSGIREEEYFPIAFSAWSRGEEVYGICANPYMDALEADRAILQNKTDIEGITEALLAYQDKAVYLEGVDSRALLRLFLEGSETLWGMIDWEKGTFDFSGELFLNLLQVAEKYGDTPDNNYPCIAQQVRYHDYYRTASISELENEGLMRAGWMFDDGCYAKAYGMPAAINSGSDRKEGAWEFLCFLLGEEAQGDVLPFPVKRDVFDGWADKFLEKVEEYRKVFVSGPDRITGEWGEVRIYGEEDIDFLKTEKIPCFEKILEESRYLPLRSAPVADILCEEAEDYFNGSKSAEEIIEVIENRVELYLNERK